MQIKPLTIELMTGYTDREGAVHKSVTFGKRLDGAFLMALDEAATATNELQTQGSFRIISHSITKFGALDSLPVPVEYLAALDEDDLNDLTKAHNKFILEGFDGRETKIISDSETMLVFGYTNNGITYNRVKFGKRVTGRDWMDADALGFGMFTLRREMFLIGRRISELSTEDGAHSIPGPIEIQVFEKLDSVDIHTLREASSRWGDTFRTGRRSAQEDGANNFTLDAAHGADGS